MNPDFRHALARLVPVFMPDLLFRLGPDGLPLFKEFAAAIRPTEFAPGQGLRHRRNDADRLLRRACRKPDCTARQSRHRHDPGTGAGDDVRLPRQPIPVAPRRRLAGARLHRDASPISPPSTRAPNSGATTAAPALRTGRRSPTRAIRWAAAKASTSASCCANCCAGST